MKNVPISGLPQSRAAAISNITNQAFAAQMKPRHARSKRKLTRQVISCRRSSPLLSSEKALLPRLRLSLSAPDFCNRKAVLDQCRFSGA